jgi:hypothetical protein
LRELDGLDLSWEESRKLARAKGKRVIACDKMQRTAKRTEVELRTSPERPKCFDFLNGREVDYTKRTRGFYELDLSSDRRD